MVPGFAGRFGIGRRRRHIHSQFLISNSELCEARKKPSVPTISGTKGQPSAVPPAFVYYHTLLSPDNGGTPVPLSGAAPGRTKRHSLGRLSAGGRPSLQSANPLFSQSAHLCCPYLYHTPAENASLKSRRREVEISEYFKKFPGQRDRAVL